jgi:hypothetical protein
MASGWNTSVRFQESSHCQCRTTKSCPGFHQKRLVGIHIFLADFNFNMNFLLPIILSMHIFFPMVGIAAKVSPIEQHCSFADVQFALRNKLN